MKKKEHMIFIRNKWEIATIEINWQTKQAQFVRRDFSFICNVGDEKARMEMPPKPK